MTVSSQSGLTAPLVLVVNNQCTLRASFTGAGDEFQTAVVAELISSVNVSVAGAAPAAVNVASATINTANRTIDFAFTATSKAEHVFTIRLKDPVGVEVQTDYTMTIASSAVFDFPNMTGVSKSPSVVTLGQPLTITSTWASALPTGTTLTATYQPSGGSVGDATVGSFNNANTACTYTFVVNTETSYAGIVTLTVGPASKQYAWTGPHVVPSFTLAGSDIHVFPDAFTVSGEVKELVGTTITLTFSGGDMLHQTGGNSVPLQIDYIKFTQDGTLYDILSSDITTSHSYETVTVSNFTPPGLGNITMHAVLRGPDHEQGDPVLSPEITFTILGTAIEPATLSPPANMIVYADFSGYTYTLTGNMTTDKNATRTLLEGMVTYTEEKFSKSSSRYRFYHDNYVGISNGNDSIIAAVRGAEHATVNGTTLPRFAGYSGWMSPGWTLDNGMNHDSHHLPWGQSDITYTTMTDIFAFKNNLPYSQWNGANYVVAGSARQWAMGYQDITYQNGNTSTSNYVNWDASIYNANGSKLNSNVPMDANTMGWTIGLVSQSNSDQPKTFWTHGEIPMGDYIYVVEIKQTFDNVSTTLTTTDGGEATIYCYDGTSWYSSTKALMSRKSHASGQWNWNQHGSYGMMGWQCIGESSTLYGENDRTWMGWAIQDDMSQATRDAIIGYYARTLAGSSPLLSLAQVIAQYSFDYTKWEQAYDFDGYTPVSNSVNNMASIGRKSYDAKVKVTTPVYIERGGRKVLSHPSENSVPFGQHYFRAPISVAMNEPFHMIYVWRQGPLNQDIAHTDRHIHLWMVQGDINHATMSTSPSPWYMENSWGTGTTSRDKFGFIRFNGDKLDEFSMQISEGNVYILDYSRDSSANISATLHSKADSQGAWVSDTFSISASAFSGAVARSFSVVSTQYNHSWHEAEAASCALLFSRTQVSQELYLPDLKAKWGPLAGTN